MCCRSAKEIELARTRRSDLVRRREVAAAARSQPVIVASHPAPRVTLRAAANDVDRGSAIQAWLQSLPPGVSPARRAIVAEGVVLDRLAPQNVPLVGLGAGCPCCTGLSVLRVVLARTLRRLRPEALLVLVAIEMHLPRLRRMLEDGELGVRFEVEA